MSELINYLKENDIISNYKIYHKKITPDHIINGKLCVEMFDRLPNTVTRKRAIYFMFNNINLTDKDYCSATLNHSVNMGKKELKYYKYVEPHTYMKTYPTVEIYMQSFCFHPTIQSDSGLIHDVSSLALIFEKENGEQIEITEQSSITYVVQHN